MNPEATPPAPKVPLRLVFHCSISAAIMLQRDDNGDVGEGSLCSIELERELVSQILEREEKEELSLICFSLLS